MISNPIDMHKIEFLTKEEYDPSVQRLQGGHWTPGTIDRRWEYHTRVIELIKAINIKQPEDVLEMGTMGVSCVHGSHSIDYTERWDFEGKKPTIVHDAREIPWPVDDKQYELFVALRVFQHLVPNQKGCVKEAMRIANKVILVVPGSYANEVLPESRGISYNDFVQFCDGRHPNLYVPTAFGDLYYWDTEKPSKLNLSGVMQQLKLVEFVRPKEKSLVRRVLEKLRLK